MALRNALLAGVLLLEDFPFIWGHQHKAGPLRSCADSIRRSGMNFNSATCCFTANGAVCALLTSPAFHVREFLLSTPTATRLRRLAARRPAFDLSLIKASTSQFT
jgi:hypothetical protein